MKNQKYLLPVIIAAIAVLGGLFVWNSQRQTGPEPTITEYEDSIQVTAPAETIDEETGEVDQAAFE